MMVNGPLEIYSTVIGAKLYDSIFNILASCGLAFVPFLALFFENITRPYEMQFGSATDVSLKRVTITFLVIVISIMLFVAPTHKLDITAITYKPSCSLMATTSRLGDTGTTYDDAFEDLDYSNIRIPLGLAIVLNGTSGITNAAIASLPCKTDVQSITNAIDTTRLTPSLKQQVERFNNECYAEARSKFDSKHPDKSSWSNTMKEYGGQSDLSWIGSHVLRQLYYGNIYPAEPVPGFPYGEFPYQFQKFNQKEGVQTPKWGFPSCEAWWTDKNYGLEGKLVALVNNRVPKNPHLGELPYTDQLSKWLAKVKTFSHLGSQVTPDDVVARGLLYDVGGAEGFGRTYTGWMHDSPIPKSEENLPNARELTVLREGAAQIGQTISALTGQVDRAEIQHEIPIIQAILMALCLSFGPIILVLGRYRINVIFTYYFILSSVISMTFVEKLIHYLELSLNASSSLGLYALGNEAVMMNIFTKLYFYGPMLYLMLMSICGVMVGRAVDGVFGGSVAGAGGIAAKGAASSLLKGGAEAAAVAV